MTKGNNNAEVDHVLQIHAKCHYAYLECVPHSENAYRTKFSSTNAARIKKKGITQGKPFDIYKDNDKVYTAATSQEGSVYIIEHLYKFPDHTDLASSIRGALNKNSAKHKCCVKLFAKHGITLKYTKEFLESQEDLPDEI